MASNGLIFSLVVANHFKKGIKIINVRLDEQKNIKVLTFFTLKDLPHFSLLMFYMFSNKITIYLTTDNKQKLFPNTNPN